MSETNGVFSMNVVRQTRPDNITKDDWNYYLSRTPIEYINETAKDLKNKNHFHADDRFEKILLYFSNSYFAKRELLPPKEMFRARVYRENDAIERYTNPNDYGMFQGYDPAGSGVAPPENAASGRVNPKGISYLYTSSDPHSALLEARTQPGEIVSVATIALKERAVLLDLTICASIFDEDPEEKTTWINRLIFGLADIFQMPLSLLGGYDLCQYISEFARNRGFDGIVYRASHVQELGTSRGINYVFFDPSKCEVVSSKLHCITSMCVETSPPL